MSCEHEFFYSPEINETGWACAHCGEKPGEPPGFCYSLDRNQIEGKVESLVFILTEQKLLHLSNSSDMEILVYSVAQRCRQKERYDQYSIVQYIFREKSGHGDYWKKISQALLQGEDTRERCACGQLATLFVGKGGKWNNYCSACKEPTDVAKMPD